MGLLTGRRPTGWVPDGTGIQPGRDDLSDIAIGSSYRVGFICESYPMHLVALTFYAIASPVQPGAFTVRMDVMKRAGVDPYDPDGIGLLIAGPKDAHLHVTPSARDAERAAYEFAEDALRRDDLDDIWRYTPNFLLGDEYRWE